MSRGHFTIIANERVDVLARDVGATAAWVYLYLLRWRMRETGVASVSYRQMTDALALSRPTLALALKRLVDAGYLSTRGARFKASYTFPRESESGKESEPDLVKNLNQTDAHLVKNLNQTDDDLVKIMNQSGKESLPNLVKNLYSSNTYDKTFSKTNDNDDGVVDTHARTREEIVSDYAPTRELMRKVKEAYPGITRATFELVLEDRRHLWLTGRGRTVAVSDDLLFSHFPRFFKAHPESRPPPSTFRQTNQQNHRNAVENVLAMVEGMNDGSESGTRGTARDYPSRGRISDGTE